jgi:hypothetical protein
LMPTDAGVIVISIGMESASACIDTVDGWLFAGMALPSAPTAHRGNE